MTPEVLLSLCLILPTVTSIVCLAAMRAPKVAAATAVLSAVAQIAVCIGLIVATDRDGYVVVQSGGWAAPFGISLVSDRFAAVMVLVTAVMSLAVVLYALTNRERNLPLVLFWPLTFLLLLGVNGSFLTGDLFNLFVWFEVMLIASFVLMTIGGTRPQLDGGMKYVLLNLFSSALFLIGVGMIYGKLGTLNMADIAAKMSTVDDPVLINTTSILLLVAFGVKAGVFPLFFWLPASYHVPAFIVSGLFAALLTKVGVYALVRSQLLLFGPYFSSMQGLLFVIAAATMVTGVLGAAAQFHTRRILSFHIISQIGYMILGLAIATPLALAGAIFYIIHNILAKTNLFLIAAMIHRKTGHEDLAKLGGLVKKLPWLAVLFLISALALAGIPPLSGFWAKFFIVQSALQADLLLLAVISLLVGMLTMFSMMKIWNEAFWKAKPENVEGPEHPIGRAGWMAHAPIAVLAAMIVAMGIFVSPVFAYFDRAAQQLLDPTSYVNAVLTPENNPIARQ